MPGNFAMEKGFRRRIVIVFFSWLSCLPGYSAEKVKTVAIFFAWDASIPAYHNILEGFRNTFGQHSGKSCNLLIEYLDMNRLHNESYAGNIIHIYNEKYRNTGIDMVIAVGPNCYPVLKKYGLKALEKAPVICVDNDDLAQDPVFREDARGVFRILVNYDFRKSIRQAIALFPDHKDIYVISGNSPTDKYYANKVKMSTASLEDDYHFIFLSGPTPDSLLRMVRKLPDDCTIIVPSFFLDVDSVSYSTPELMSLLSRNSKVPVLPLVDTYMNRRGGLGGYLLCFKEVGRAMGIAADETFSGVPFDQIRIRYSYFKEMYDWDELKRWGLTKSPAVSSSAILLFKSPSFFQQNLGYIIVILFFVLSQSIFIVYLYKLNRRQKETLRTKTENEFIYRDLVRRDRLLKMSELAASLSHELNQPLTAILFNAQAGKRFIQSGTFDPKQAEEIFDYIIEDDKRAGGIISSVKGLMKEDNPEKANLNLNLVIDETYEIVYSEAIANKIQMKKYLEEYPVIVFGQKILLQQVMLNFLRNAMNAVDENPDCEKLIEISMKALKGYVTVSVRDSGKGINPEIKDKLFQPFITGRKEGFGMGLALSRTIIEKHHGEIWAKNLSGGGAEFSFRLKTAR
jgi:signal transduction histidine kinase